MAGFLLPVVQTTLLEQAIPGLDITRRVVMKHQINLKPRNHVVLAARGRNGAGVHGKTEKAMRREAKNALRKEVWS